MASEKSTEENKIKTTLLLNITNDNEIDIFNTFEKCKIEKLDDQN